MKFSVIRKDVGYTPSDKRAFHTEYIEAQRVEVEGFHAVFYASDGGVSLVLANGSFVEIRRCAT